LKFGFIAANKGWKQFLPMRNIDLSGKLVNMKLLSVINFDLYFCINEHAKARMKSHGKIGFDLMI
jgi:hypothetical protein